MQNIITSYDTQSIGNSVVTALVSQELARQSARRAEEEARRAEQTRREIAALRAQLQLRKDRDERYYREKILEARRAYAPPEPHGPVAEFLSGVCWGAVGMIVLAFDALDEWVMRSARGEWR